MEEASPSLENCLIRFNTRGIDAVDASPSIVNCVIADNTEYGVHLEGSCSPAFGASLSEWSDIYGNGPGDPGRDLRNGTEDIMARYVYWGTTVESLIEERIWHEPDDPELGLVDYSPWTDALHSVLFYGTSGVECRDPELPETFSLAQNRPNPFSASTEIRYELPVKCDVLLEVFDVRGRRIATLAAGVETPGSKVRRWEVGGAGSGVYFYRLTAGDFVRTGKMLVLE